ncbi:hypothetical protein [Caldimonas sp. KR1-144]|uniref:hypothetical protein n=1 Tax=Caldimonas sp. KR1-144 TaxID=3400911 RepID=UPI003C010F33
MDRVIEYFLTEPRRLTSLGRALIRFGGGVLTIGAIGNVANAAVGIVQTMGKKLATEQTLATLYPSLPTWWIPESIVGCLPAVVAVITGIVLTQMGERLRAYL